MEERPRRWGLRCPAPLFCPVRRLGLRDKAEAKPAEAAAATVPKEAEQSEPEEQICRFCFEGPEVGELISPCRCSGGQKYIHLQCLRLWQRAVLVSQPTHPDLYDNDTRQRICNVCKTEFSCRPPTRAELLAAFTGPELAALIEEGCFIGSAEDFSQELERQVRHFPEHLSEGIVCRNWIRGLFLIVKVVEDRHRESVKLKVTNHEDLGLFVEQLGQDARSFHMRGRRFVLLMQGPLRDVPSSASAEQVRRAIREVRTPALFYLKPDQTNDCGEDGIVAVNLSRPFQLPTNSTASMLRLRQRNLFIATVRKVLNGSSADLSCKVTHFIGGPCEEDKVAACIMVIDGEYHVIQDKGNEEETLHNGLLLAEEAAARHSGGAPAGQSAAAAAGAAAAAALQLDGSPQAPCTSVPPPPAEGEAEVKRRRLETESNGSRPQAEGSPKEAESASSSSFPFEPVRLFVYWGYAGWSRCQLMGEIARGSWGLCRAATEDVVAKAPHEVWADVYKRLIFAPRSEMSETYNGQDPEDEGQRQELRRMAILHDLLRRGRRGAIRRALAQRAGDDDEEEEGAAEPPGEPAAALRALGEEEVIMEEAADSDDMDDSMGHEDVEDEDSEDDEEVNEDDSDEDDLGVDLEPVD